MPASVKIRKGLDIRLKGGAHGESHAVSAADRFSLHPTDFHGLVPRMAAKAGTEVKAGDVLFTDKKNPEIQFVSAISGTVQEPVRGEKRASSASTLSPEETGLSSLMPSPGSATADAIRSTMLAHGFWPMLRQRPFDVMPAPDSTPRDIFVSTHDSAPLAPTAAQVVGGRLDDLKKGIAFLNTLLGDGKKVQLGIEAGDGTLASLDGAEVTSSLARTRPATSASRSTAWPR